MAFALEKHRKADEPSKTDYAMPINTTVTGLASNLDLNKAGLSEQPLAQALKGIRGHSAELLQQCLSP